MSSFSDFFSPLPYCVCCVVPPRVRLRTFSIFRLTSMKRAREVVDKPDVIYMTSIYRLNLTNRGAFRVVLLNDDLATRLLLGRPLARATSASKKAAAPISPIFAVGKTAVQLRPSSLFFQAHQLYSRDARDSSPAGRPVRQPDWSQGERQGSQPRLHFAAVHGCILTFSRFALPHSSGRLSRTNMA